MVPIRGRNEAWGRTAAGHGVGDIKEVKSAEFGNRSSVVKRRDPAEGLALVFIQMLPCARSFEA